MIRFFRKTRIKLLTENKLTKYIIYAFGEVLIVIIGILIAIQINSWNNDRIQAKKETAYIEEIRKSLISDLESIAFIKDFNEKKDSCINRSLELLGTKMSNEERALEFMTLMIESTGRYEIFRQNSVAFNGMISAETIELISNDSLRMALSEYYGMEAEYESDTQSGVREFTRKFVEVAGPSVMSNELASQLYGSNLDFEFSGMQNNEFHKDPEVFFRLLLMKLNMQDQNETLEKTKLKIEQVLELISKKSEKAKMLLK
ncbi:MAG: DUF6090 family protein [Bacteroides sp.]|jgi:uncharacterized membrane protein YcgQ (UPF0703/DUF1980 family)|nr:DUF6090 family protein [Bacteroides sp.]